MLRIACYGYLEKDTGSVTGANYLMIQELLSRGFEIDFFGWIDVSQSVECLRRSNFRFIELPDKSFLRKSIKRFLPKQFYSLFDRTLGGLMENLYSNRRKHSTLHNAVATEHSKQNYDLLLFLGLYAPFRLNGAPTVSWAQGTPHTEWLYIKSLRKTIIQLCGLVTYLQFKFFYMLKNLRIKAELKNSDVFICGSQWAKEQMIAYGIESNSIRVLPYPIELDLFKPELSEEVTKSSKRTFLWLGRIDPRKRLDLLLEAYALLLKERQDVHLKIFGGLRHTKGYKQLIDSFEFPEHLDYQPSISREQVPDLFRACDILIQPSEGENFGSSVAEALCCGVPVILGATNGTKEFTSPLCSFIFEQYTPEALKQTMVQALDALAQSPTEIALNARQTAEKNFLMDRVIDDLEEIFQDALSLSPSSSNLRWLNKRPKRCEVE